MPCEVFAVSLGNGWYMTRLSSKSGAAESYDMGMLKLLGCAYLQPDGLLGRVKLAPKRAIIRESLIGDVTKKKKTYYIWHLGGKTSFDR
jgi:hypothetical protein